MGKRQNANTLESANHRAKESDICCSGIVLSLIVGTFDRLVLQGHSGLIWCTCLKMACNSKVACFRAERIEIWESWVVVICVWAYS